MSEFGQMWRLVSKEDYDKFQQKRVMEKVNKTENLRELLEEAFNAGVSWVAGTDNFEQWFEKRFS